MSKYFVFNYLFYLLIFVGFFLPTNNTFYIPLPGVLLKFNELALLGLPVVNELCKSKYSFRLRSKKLRLLSLSLLMLILFNELVLKSIVYSQSISDGVKSLRYALPLLVSLFLLFRGINTNIKQLYYVFIITILTSYLLSLISLVYPLPIYYNLDNSEDVLSAFSGRLINGNASFGLIGVYLLLKKCNSFFYDKKIYKAVYILSIIILVMTFNRTFLAAIFVEVIILTFKSFNVKKAISAIFVGVVGIIVAFLLYNSNETIRKQIDRRILPILTQEQSISENAVQDSRQVIYDGVFRRLSESYWIAGLDFKTKIFEIQRIDGIYEASKTDISFINILLRFGIVPLILYLILLKRLYKLKLFFPLVLVVIMLTSLNIDLLMNQNTIFFIVLYVSFINLNNITNIRRIPNEDRPKYAF
ncbi:hypothetical protein [Sphingobacterium sp. WOUb80]|uniref:hypothetical protein n=1 Tax=Sphingobacterium sp. WOUb80 TaxID=3234028 RepID=UPI003CE8D1FB